MPASFAQLSFTVPTVPFAIIAASTVIITMLLSYVVSLLESNPIKMISLTINFSNILL